MRCSLLYSFAEAEVRCTWYQFDFTIVRIGLAAMFFNPKMRQTTIEKILSVVQCCTLKRWGSLGDIRGLDGRNSNLILSLVRAGLRVDAGAEAGLPLLLNCLL
jgi:hypothetical protein